MRQHDIVIVGGGFAGTTLARELERRLPNQADIALISRENYITYTPLLSEVVGASILPGHAVAPLRQVLGRSRFYRATVTGLDLAQRRLQLDDGPGPVGFKQLVLACGITARLDMIPGMAEHSLPLKTLGDALALRNHILQRLEAREISDDPATRRHLATFVVVGGGSNGVEVAGAILDLLRASRRLYPSLGDGDYRVVVLEMLDHLLEGFPAQLQGVAARHLSGRGVEIRTEVQVAAIDSKGVELASGERLEGGTVVCTIGVTPGPLLKSLDLPKRKGYLETKGDFSIPDHPGLWALGDCAVTPDAGSDSPCPPTAQSAVRQARHLARNLAALGQDRPTQPFTYRSLGEMAVTGHRRGVARVLGVNLSGFPAWLVWRGYYWSQLPTALRKTQVASQWLLDLPFPQDVTQLHLERSGTPPDSH